MIGVVEASGGVALEIAGWEFAKDLAAAGDAEEVALHVDLHSPRQPVQDFDVVFVAELQIEKGIR